MPGAAVDVRLGEQHLRKLPAKHCSPPRAREQVCAARRGREGAMDHAEHRTPQTLRHADLPEIARRHRLDLEPRLVEQRVELVGSVLAVVARTLAEGRPVVIHDGTPPRQHAADAFDRERIGRRHDQKAPGLRTRWISASAQTGLTARCSIISANNTTSNVPPG